MADARAATALMADAVLPRHQGRLRPRDDNGFYYDYDKPGGPFTDDDLRASRPS
jgi:hypothetical protein